MAQDEWAPHAEKEFGRFTHALAKRLPRTLGQVRAAGRNMAAITATTTRKPKR